MTTAAWLGDTRVLLCDADGNLFPSEEPAFVASAEVTNGFLASLGIDARFTAEQLRVATTGRNFRTTAVDLAAANGVRLEGAPAESTGSGARLSVADLDRWVEEENAVVTAYLGRVLRPDLAVLEPLTRLAGHYELAIVSSSALGRLDACLRATALADLFPPDRRFSAEDSLPNPTSKPDPAVYLHAVARIGLRSDQAVAVEDSIPGAGSALAAAVPTVGNVAFVPPGERDLRTTELLSAGVFAVVESWSELESALRAAAA